MCLTGLLRSSRWRVTFSLPRCLFPARDLLNNLIKGSRMYWLSQWVLQARDTFFPYIYITTEQGGSMQTCRRAEGSPWIKICLGYGHLRLAAWTAKWVLVSKKKNQPNQRNTRKRRRRRRRKREREKEKYVGGRQITNRSKQKNIDCWLEVSSTFGFPLFISLATQNSPYLQSPSLIIG